MFKRINPYIIVIEYRYQKKNGIIFRACFTPWIAANMFIPWIGISCDYSL